MISKGEVITSVNDQNDFIKVMLGTFAVGGHSKYPLGFTFGNSHRQFYWGYSLISAGEPITDAERMDDLLEVMTGSRNGYEGSNIGSRLAWSGALLNYGDNEDNFYTPEWDEEDYEPDVDEAQEWHDFDPDC